MKFSHVLSIFLYLFSRFEDFESRWMLFCEYICNQDKLQDRFDLEVRMQP